MTRTFGYDEFPTIFHDVLTTRIMVCTKCGYPIGTLKNKRGRKCWHCYHCQKFRKGGSTDDVKWIITKGEEL